MDTMHEMRRSDRQLTAEETEAILKENIYGVLSTVGEDGFPYGVPLTYIYENGSIYFHSATSGHKLQNLEHESRASFCVVGRTELLPGQFSTRYESAIAFGVVRELEGDEKRTALLHLVERLAPDFYEKGVQYIQGAGDKTRVFCLPVNRLSGKARR